MFKEGAVKRASFKTEDEIALLVRGGLYVIK